METDWIALDWGSSNLRAWAMGADGAVLAEGRGAQGCNGLTPAAFEAALLAVIEPWLPPDSVTDVLACGMLGARQGWVEAGYAPVPTPPGVGTTIAPTSGGINVHVLGGVSQLNPPDVMRGEETQIAGFLAREPGFNGVLCLPGTHSKWVQIRDGEIFHFASFITGELFNLLSTQSVLRHDLGGDGWDDAAHLAAIEDAMARPERMASALFSLRAEVLLKGLSAGAGRARLSGWLIGMELAGARPYWLGQEVVLIADAMLADRYGAALGHVAAELRVVSAEAMVLDGLRAARQRQLSR